MAVVGEAYVVVRAITTGFQKEVQNAIKGVNAQQSGRNLGQSFSKGFSSGASKNLSRFAREAEAANDAFKKLVITGYYMGPAISAAVSALSSLVSGLVAFTSQVAAALPSLVVLPSVFTAMGQAMLTAKLAFGGLGKAIGEMSNAGAKTKKLETALSRVESAERRVLKARNALTKAYETARERIQQLGFDTEDAAIAEKRAALELEDARKTLARVQDLPPNNRARIEAELAFQEADLNYRRAIDRSADLTAEQNKVTANGTRNAKEQEANSEEVLTAQEELRLSLRELAKAQKAAKDEASGKGAGGPSAVSKLSEEAKAFAKFIVSLKPKLTELKEAAGKELFPALTTAISNLANDPKLFPMLREQLQLTGAALGQSAIDFSKLLRSADNVKNLNTVMTTNRDTVSKLGKVVGNLFSAFLSLLSAADPLVRRFTDWAVALSETIKQTTEAKNKTGELTKTFSYAGDVAAQLGRIFKNIWNALKIIGRVAAGPGSAGEGLVNSFEGATKKFEEFVAKLEESGRLDKFFKDAAKNTEKIGRLLNSVVLEFIKLGDNPSVGATADKLSNVAETVGGAVRRLTDGAPALGEFVDKFAKFMALFAESQSINNFFKALGFGLDILIKIFSNETVAKIAMFVGAQLAFVKAASVMASMASFAGKVVFGYGVKIGKAVSFIKGAPGTISAFAKTIPNIVAKVGILETAILKLSYAMGISVGASTAIIVGAIAAVVAIFVLMYMKSEKLREALSKLGGTIMDSIGRAFETINAALDSVAPGLGGVGGLFKAMGDAVATYVIPVVSWLAEYLIGNLANAIAGVIRIIGGLVNIISVPFKVLGAFMKLFKGDWDGFLEGMKGAVGSWVSGIKKIVKGILQAFATPLNAIIRLWNSTVGKFGFTTPSWLGPLGGKTFNMPKIPEINFTVGGDDDGGGGTPARRMALGGIVYPRSGGTLATIAEAGKPERVEPLDKDGLSKRDRAIIAMLSGGGSTINVYPSPGMDEVELASLVNRQIAFQLRKGSA